MSAQHLHLELSTQYEGLKIIIKINGLVMDITPENDSEQWSSDLVRKDGNTLERLQSPVRRA